MFTSDQLKIDRDGHIVTLTMNRPEKRNAFGLEMLIAMAEKHPLLHMGSLCEAGWCRTSRSSNTTTPRCAPSS